MESPELEKIRDEFAEIAGQLSGRLGLSRTVGQLYALLFLSDEPVCLDYMVERLKISKGSVSTNIRELEKWGAVRKVWVKGSRKDFYEANPDTLKIVINRFKIGIQQRLNEMLEGIDRFEKVISEMESSLPIEEKKKAQFYREKFRKVKKMQTLVNTFLKVIPKKIFL
ncbi:MAG: GbsR/MarR family transcriptional regulator [bacterium]